MIDILLSTYNGEGFLSAQLDSILAQSYQDWQLLIRDDGSADSTIEIISAYARQYPDKIKIVEDTRGNLGCLCSFEALLERSTSAYIMFADQDDVWLEDKVERSIVAIRTIEEPNKPCLVCSDLLVVDVNLNTIHDSHWAFVRISPELLAKPKALAVCNYVTGCTMLFNKTAKDLSLPFGAHAILHDSWIALIVASKGGEIFTLPLPTVLYRQHYGNEVGAVKKEKGWRYRLKRMVNVASDYKTLMATYKQAQEVLGISFISFIFSKVQYLIKRS